MTRPTKRSPAPLPFSDQVGKTLRRRRLDLKVSLDEVAQETKIQKGYIKAIEKADYARLPHSVQMLGFVKRYARLLGLDENTAAAKYLLERGKIARPRARPPRQKVRRTLIGSRILSGFGLAAVVGVIVGYLVWQFALLTSPPRLNLLLPPENQAVTSQSVVLSGKTTPGVEVKVGGQVVFVSESGDFSTTVVLSPGLNTIKVIATSRQNQTSTQERNVYYSPR